MAPFDIVFMPGMPKPPPGAEMPGTMSTFTIMPLVEDVAVQNAWG